MIIAEAEAASLEQLQAAAASLPKSALEVKVELFPPKWLFWRKRKTVCRINGGCACDLLTDQADWNADVWDMLPEKLPALAETLQALAEKAPDGLRVEALWVGDQPEEEIRVTPKELAEMARSSKLGTKSSYIVHL
jgi:hypothetical protein